MRVEWIVPALVVAACGQTGSGESMASAGNALTPQEVDAVLGPEPSGQAPTESPEIGAMESAQPGAAAEPEEESASSEVRATPQPTEPAETPALVAEEIMENSE